MMKLSSSFLLLALAAKSTMAYPTPNGHTARGLLDRVLLFDGAAFPDPINPANTLVQIGSYVSLRTPDLGVATATVTAFLTSLGIPVGNSLTTLQDRLKVLASIGLPGKEVEITLNGCSNKGVKLPKTDTGDLGLSSGIVNLGQGSSVAQGTSSELTANVVAGLFDSRSVQASVFFSPNSGFGVISDIDDTIKVSNVLDKLALVKSTLLEEPKAVPGMPELYRSLKTSLSSPQFVYITGTPYQFYPFLNNFIDTSFADSKGPILSQNLTIVDIPEAIEFVTGGNDATKVHKLKMIDQLQAMYSNKKWLAVGDSTQKDPEVYAEAFRKFGPNFITCIWIREVQGADNSLERFNRAFEGVPADKVKVYKDADIPSLAGINVAGGQCI